MEEMTEKKPTRDKKGRIVKGSLPLNYSGNNGITSSAEYKKIMDFYLTEYSLDELKSLVKNTDKMGKMPVIHAQILLHIAASIAGGKERGKERERMYDRMWGKPVQTIVMPERKKPLPDDVNNIPDNEAESVHEQLLSE